MEQGLVASCRDVMTWKQILALCEGNPPVTGGFPSQWDSIVAGLSHAAGSGGIMWRCHDMETNTGPLWGESTGDQWIPLTMGQYSLLWRILRFDVSCVVSHHRLRLRQNRRRFADNNFKCIFLNENIQTLINMSLKSIPKGRINTILALVSTKPLSEPMMISLRTHICVTGPDCGCPNTIMPIWCHCNVRMGASCHL